MPCDPDVLENLDAVLAGLGRCICSGFLVPRSLEVLEKFRRHIELFDSGIRREVTDVDLLKGSFSIVRSAFNHARDYKIEQGLLRIPADLGTMQDILQAKLELVYLARLVKKGFLVPRYYDPREFELDVTLCAQEGTTIILNLYLEEFKVAADVLNRFAPTPPSSPEAPDLLPDIIEAVPDPIFGDLIIDETV